MMYFKGMLPEEEERVQQQGEHSSDACGSSPPGG